MQVWSLGQEDPLEGHGNPLQYSFHENLMDGGAQWAIVQGGLMSQTQLKQVSMHNGIVLQYLAKFGINIK